MTRHRRIRPFNTRDTYPEQNIDNDLCQAVVATGTTIFLRGQVSQDLETRESLFIGDPVLQTRQTMQNIKMLINEADGNMHDICRIVVYLTDVRHREPIYREMVRTFERRFSVFHRHCSHRLGASRMGGGN